MKTKRIKIIGDSIAAGAGCSRFQETTDVVMVSEGKKYFRCEAETSWWGLMQKDGYQVRSLGCCGANSSQVLEHLEEMIEEQDELVLVLVGLNDRKRVDGMRELPVNIRAICRKLRDMGKEIVLITPLPSTYENEHWENRLHHTDEVVAILREAAKELKIPLVDHYQFAEDYLQEHNLKIEDIILGEGCKNDGLHPADFAQKLMYEHLIETGVLN